MDLKTVCTQEKLWKVFEVVMDKLSHHTAFQTYHVAWVKADSLSHSQVGEQQLSLLIPFHL